MGNMKKKDENRAPANTRGHGQIIFLNRHFGQTPGQRPTITVKRLQTNRVPQMQETLNTLRAQLENFAQRPNLSETNKRKLMQFRKRYEETGKRINGLAKLVEGLPSRSSAIILQDIPVPSTSRGIQQAPRNQSQIMPGMTQKLINLRVGSVAPMPMTTTVIRALMNRVVNAHTDYLRRKNSMFTTNRIEFKKRVREALKIKLSEHTNPDSIQCIVCCEKSVDAVLCHDDCTVCLHTCLTCIKKWASIKNSCPTCRKPVACVGDLVKFLNWTQKSNNTGNK